MAFHSGSVGCFPGDCHLPSGKWPQQKNPEVHSEVQNWGGMVGWRRGTTQLREPWRTSPRSKREHTWQKHLSPPEKTGTPLHSVSPEWRFRSAFSPPSSVSTLEEPEAAPWVNEREQQWRQKNKEAKDMSPSCSKRQPEEGGSWWKEGPLEKLLTLNDLLSLWSIQQNGQSSYEKEIIFNGWD